MAAPAHDTAATLAQRLDFVGLDQQSLGNLAELQPLVERTIRPALEAFYAKLRQTPDVARLFADEGHIASARQRQEAHWGAIAAARFDRDYAEGVRRIGRTHARIGLEPRWYIGGYALILEQLIRALVRERWPRLLARVRGRPELLADALTSLVKAAMLDMDLAISVYLDTLDEQRRVAEEAQAAMERDGAAAVAAVAAGLAKLAGKDLTSRIDVELAAVFGKLKQDFNGAADQMEAAMRAVRETTDAVASGAQQISDAAGQLSLRNEQQAAAVEETAAALEEIAATVQKSAEGADHARQLVANADDGAKQSAQVTRQAVEAMAEIAQSSKQIGRIIGVIDEIAFQTNLLALNAGVEAARAGEAGRGFAVVASEVRALAQRSAEAAKEIKALIAASAAQVDHGVALVGEAGQSLERIAAQVAEINAVVANIAVGAKEQATALSQINVAVNNVDKATQQNAAMSEEATAASRAVSGEAQRLSDLVEGFVVTKTDARAAAVGGETRREARRASA